jgi:hypothetical protein
VALISIGGIFIEGSDPLVPESPTQEEVTVRIQEFLSSPPISVNVPRDVDRSKTRVWHPGYDVRGAQEDYNSGFLLDRLIELEAEGVVGGLPQKHYSFVGASS